MKKVTSFLFAFIFSLAMTAQTPQSFKYQTVARNNAGEILASQNISFRMSILQDSPVDSKSPGEYTVLYTETHAATTNASGLATLEIGRGTPVTGSFATINWSTTPIFLKAEIDPAGGNNFVEMGISELLSVPYALYSANGVQSMTTNERDALENPPVGMQIYNSTSNCLNYFNGTSWFETCGYRTPQPTQAAAGDDQSFTDNTISTTLAGNSPTQGTGLWTVVFGEGGSFDDATNPAATFTGEPCTDYTLAWSISTSCGTSTDNAEVSFFATPTEANAGNDTIVEGGDVTLYLSANTPIIGSGLWSVLSGEGGTFDDATNPTALFTGLPEVTYTLQWAIATVCDSSYDEVTIAFYTWQCGKPFTDTRDSKTYSTVQIGAQCWMGQNLNVGTRIAGTANPANNATIEKYCYSNSDAHCDVYGGLYQWNEMMNYTTTPGVQGICADGWHLPSDAEWTNLITYLGGESVAGGKMKETGTTHWISPNSGATNSSGFSGLPGGFRHTNGTFGDIGYSGWFWSSSEYSTTNAWFRYLFYTNAFIIRNYTSKSYGFSVRCLRD